jgi:hypothetical protein
MFSSCLLQRAKSAPDFPAAWHKRRAGRLVHPQEVRRRGLGQIDLNS